MTDTHMEETRPCETGRDTLVRLQQLMNKWEAEFKAMNVLHQQHQVSEEQRQFELIMLLVRDEPEYDELTSLGSISLNTHRSSTALPDSPGQLSTHQCNLYSATTGRNVQEQHPTAAVKPKTHVSAQQPLKQTSSHEAESIMERLSISHHTTLQQPHSPDASVSAAYQCIADPTALAAGRYGHRDMVCGDAAGQQADAPCNPDEKRVRSRGGARANRARRNAEMRALRGSMVAAARAPPHLPTNPLSAQTSTAGPDSGHKAVPGGLVSAAAATGQQHFGGSVAALAAERGMVGPAAAAAGRTFGAAFAGIGSTAANRSRGGSVEVKGRDMQQTRRYQAARTAHASAASHMQHVAQHMSGWGYGQGYQTCSTAPTAQVLPPGPPAGSIATTAVAAAHYSHNPSGFRAPAANTGPAPFNRYIQQQQQQQQQQQRKRPGEGYPWQQYGRGLLPMQQQARSPPAMTGFDSSWPTAPQPPKKQRWDHA